MPCLLLMRHAKSDWSDSSRDDHDRPLNRRGKQDAARMGRWLVAQGCIPTAMLSSSARRARKTAARIAAELPDDVPVELRDDLYRASVEHWRAVLARQPIAACLLCVGHNPELEALLEQLTGRTERLPTGAVARLVVPSEDWSTLADEQPQLALQAIWRPKELPDEASWTP